MRIITQGYGGSLVVTQGYSPYIWTTPTYLPRGPLAGFVRPHGLRSQPKPALLASKPQDHRERTQNPR